MSSLELHDVSVAYGNIVAVEGVNLVVRKGSIVCILGANGAGKSSLLKAIVGMAPVRAGQILYDGADITGMQPYQAIERGITLCPEGRRLFPDMSVFDNLRIGAYQLRSRVEFLDRLQWIYGLFPRLRERVTQMAGSLSGGEQQMCSISRALMSRPRLLLLDEPSLGLAPKVIAEVARIITEINASGITIVLVEQNAKLALRLSEYGYVLESGGVALHGSSDSLRSNSHVKALYLGEQQATGTSPATPR